MWLMVWLAASMPSWSGFTSTVVSWGLVMRENSELLKDTMDKSFGTRSPSLPQNCSSTTARMSSLTSMAVGWFGAVSRAFSAPS